MTNRRTWVRRTCRVGVVLALLWLVTSCRLARTMYDTGDLVPGERAVSLTFDDGPGPDTAALLDVLDRHGVRATFFVTGTMVSRNPGMVDEIVRRGHVVGNHTWTHPDLRRIDDRRRFDEIAPLNWFLAARGISTRCVRPPYGSSDDSVVRHVREQHGGAHTMLWTIDPRDWQAPPPSVIADRVVGALQPGGVVVLHDGPARRSNTVQAVDAMIPRIKAAGYEIRPVCGTGPSPGRPTTPK